MPSCSDLIPFPALPDSGYLDNDVATKESDPNLMLVRYSWLPIDGLSR